MELLKELGERYGFQVFGVLCPVAYFDFGRMDGSYDGNSVTISVEKSKRPDTGDAFYFPPLPTYLTRENTDEEIQDALRKIK